MGQNLSRGPISLCLHPSGHKLPSLMALPIDELQRQHTTGSPLPHKSTDLILQDGSRRDCIPPHGSTLPALCRDNRWVLDSSTLNLSRRPNANTLLSTVGRDKLLRTLQYFSRFYAWYLFRTNNPARLIAPYEAIKKQFGLTRKALRLGKNVEHFKAAAVAADSKNMDPVLKYCAVGRQLGYAMYLSLDAVTYVSAYLASLREGIG